MAKPDWFQSYDGMPEPMPKKPKPSPTPTRKKLPDVPKKSRGSSISDTYTTSIGGAGMSFDYKMS